MTINEAQLSGAARNLPSGGLIAIAWAGVALAGFLASLRFFTRFRENGRLMTDDYWLLAAWIFLVINALLQTLQTPHLYYLVFAGAGRVSAGQPLLDAGNAYVRYEFVIIALFWTVLWCVKASFLALFYRLFVGLKTYKRNWWAVVAFTAIAYVGCWLASALNCHPAGNYFKFGSCDSAADHRGSVISIVYSTTVDILSDVMIMTLPLPLLSILQISKKQKYGLAGVFSIGVIIIIVAIIRAIEINNNERTDPVALAVWGLVESTVSVCVGSLPPLKSWISRRSGSSRAQNYPMASRTGVSARSGKPGVRLQSSDGIVVQRSYQVHRGKYGSEEQLQLPQEMWVSADSDPKAEATVSTHAM